MQIPPAPASDELDEDYDDPIDVVLGLIMDMVGGDPDQATTLAAQVLHICMVENDTKNIDIEGAEGDPCLRADLVADLEDEAPAGTVFH